MILDKIRDQTGMGKIGHINKKMDELHEQFVEMGQLKSDFDIEKFTVKRDGNFIAHNFHFLMRQYTLALGESNRLLIEHEECSRKIKELEKKDLNSTTFDDEGKSRYVDLEIMKLTNNLKGKEVQLANKLNMVDQFEKMRIRLIDINGGLITNEQYQKEEPDYWLWFLKNRAMYQAQERLTGVTAGIYENIDYLESVPLINKDFQRTMLNDQGLLDLPKIQKELATKRGELDDKTHNQIPDAQEQ